MVPAPTPFGLPGTFDTETYPVPPVNPGSFPRHAILPPLYVKMLHRNPLATGEAIDGMENAIREAFMLTRQAGAAVGG